jgi:hypothetical protein
MEFSEKELRILLQSLYRLRSDVSGASQEERNRLSNVETIVARIESVIGPPEREDSYFDRAMSKMLASIVPARVMGAAAKAKAEGGSAAKAGAKGAAKKVATKKPAAKAAAKKPSGAKKAPAKKATKRK